MTTFSNKSVWSTYSPEKLKVFAQQIFDHYRLVGYPHYVYDDYGKLKQLRRLADANHCKLEASGFGAGYVGQNMVGLPSTKPQLETPYAPSLRADQIEPGSLKTLRLSLRGRIGLSG
jgi:hypothetical protein